MSLFFLLILIGVAIFFYRRWAKKQRRLSLLSSRITDHQRDVIGRCVPMVHKIPTEFHRPLEGKINLFLDQVTMVGYHGLEVTEEMELSIATQACLLVMNTNAWYDTLTTVMIYPGAFKSKTARHDGFVVTEKETVRTGESWNRGPVILSWTHSNDGALDTGDGHNVVLHEFAHQLDERSGRADGAPVLRRGQDFSTWEAVFLAAFDRLDDRVSRGLPTVMDAYGTENHQEFFAVGVETFFESPIELKRAEPAFYEQLSELLGLDPASWT